MNKHSIEGRKPLNNFQHCLKIMRITLSFLFFCILFSSASNSYSQKFTIKSKTASIKEVCKEIEKGSDYVFIFSDNCEKLIDKKVNVEANSKDVTEVLNAVLSSTGLTYKILDKQIVVYKSTESAPSVAVEQPDINIIQQPAKKQITGKVVDAQGDAIIGANIIETGTTNGTVTDIDGKFSLSVGDNATIRISYIGYLEQSISTTGQSIFNITLLEDTQALEEVVVVGYGIQKKINLTGAISNVTSEEIQSVPATSISSLLQGRMPGVTVQINNGQPGKDQGSIRVRGVGTLGNANAMVLVDGIVGNMNDVNPSDIETITVLKDATSAAIYGSRAANGVILITTKKGKQGDVLVNYRMDIGKQEMTSLPEILDTWQSSTLYNEALVNEGKSPKYSEAEIQLFKDGTNPLYPNTDWYDLFWRGNGIQQSHYFDVSGGTEKTQAYISMGYVSQNGLVEESNLNRYATTFKIDNQLTDKIKLSGKFSYTQERFKEPISNIHSLSFDYLNFASKAIGRVVPYMYNGYYGYSDEGNPIAVLKSGSHNFNVSHRLVAMFEGDAELIKDLHLKPMFGYTGNFINRKSKVSDVQYYNIHTGAPTVWQGPNRVAASTNFSDNITLQLLLQYNKTLGNHEISLLGGLSQEYWRNNYLYGGRYGYLNNALLELDAGPVLGQTNSGNAGEYALQSTFGRINYSFLGKYLLEGVIRYDGSSRFTPSNRWSTFPSLSAGWRISEELFFQPLKPFITDLKIRGSWGKLGNQDIGLYPYQATIATGLNYPFGDQTASGVAPVDGVNENIKWETTTTSDVGFDATLMDGKFIITGDYFIRNTDDILLQLPVMAAYGLSSPYVNAGSVQNKGVEFSVDYNYIKNDFSLNTNFNISYIKNKITDLAGTGPYRGGYTIQEEGLPIYSLYGLVSEGLFQSEAEIEAHSDQSGLGGPVAPGDIKYKDVDGNGVINNDDREYLGPYFPELTYGLNFTAKYKDFDLVLFLQGAGRVKSYVNSRALGSLYDINGQPTSIWWDRWTPSNPDATFPRVWNSYTQNNPENRASSYWVRDADYLRLKNLQIGYTLPKKISNNLGLRNARIFLTGNNLLTFTRFYDWIDPEAPTGGTNWTYPMVKIYSIGVNLTF